MRKVFFFLPLFIFLSCTSLTTRKKIRLAGDQLISKAKAYQHNTIPAFCMIDSVLCYRSDLPLTKVKSQRPLFQPTEQEYPDLIPEKEKKISGKLTVPDSIKQKIHFIRTQIDPQSDTVFIMSSPLLKTSEKGVYAIQYYRFSSVKENKVYFRVASRYFELFTLKKGKLHLLRTVQSDWDFFNP